MEVTLDKEQRKASPGYRRRIRVLEKTLKKKSLGKAKEDVAIKFQLLVRLREVDRRGYIWCILCDARHHYKANMVDAGHFHSRIYASTLFDFRNCHPCCKVCNVTEGGNKKEYERWMSLFYSGDEISDLQARRNVVTQWTIRELAEMKAGFLDEIRYETERIEKGDPPDSEYPTLSDLIGSADDDIRF